jgi:hypothetical protein
VGQAGQYIVISLRDDNRNIGVGSPRGSGRSFSITASRSVIGPTILPTGAKVFMLGGKVAGS